MGHREHALGVPLPPAYQRSESVFSRHSAASSAGRRWPFAWLPAAGPGGQHVTAEEADEQNARRHRLRAWLAMYKCLLGTAVLSMPHAMQETGLLLFPCELLFFALCAQFGCHLLSRTLDIVGSADIDAVQLGQWVLGNFGARVSLFVVGLDSWGATVALLRTCAEVTRSLLQEPSVLGDSPWATDGPISAYLCVLVFPLLLYRGTGAGMAWVNLLGVGALLGLIVALIVDCAQHAQSVAHQDVARVNWNALMALPVCAFAFDGAQINTFPFFRELPGPLPAGTTRGQVLSKITFAACVSSAATYYAVAFIAYSTYLGRTKANIMDNMSNDRVVYVIIKLAFSMSMLLTIPVTVFESVAVVQEAFCGPSERIANMLKFMLLLTGGVVASFVPSMYAAFAYVGATTATMWIAVLPSMFFLGAVHKHYRGPLADWNGDEGDCNGVQEDPEKDEGADLLSQPRHHPLPPPPSYTTIVAARFFLACGILAMPFFVYATAVGS